MDMKHILSLIITFIACLSVWGQNPYDKYEKLYEGCVDGKESTIYGGTYGSWPPEMNVPEFPNGGDVEFTRFIYENLTYPYGSAGSVYNQSSPLVNAMRKPGEWNVYDIIYTAPTFKADGTYRTNPYVTILFNGVLVLADVLHKEPDGKISIYEVKHSCIMKEVFVKDVAIQRYVIAHNLPLAHFYLVLDSGDGKFNLIDLLQQSPEEEASIADNIYRMKAMLQGTEPLIPMGAQCALPYPCPYREHCQKAQKNKQLELQFG